MKTLKESDTFSANVIYLEGLNKCPQQNPYCVALSQQFNESSCSEKFQETHIDGVHRLNRKKEQINCVHVTKVT